MQFTIWARRWIAGAAVLGAFIAVGASSQRATATGGNPAILEPSQGALFGAWTKPRNGRTAQQELAYTEQQLGRSFDIYHVYYHVSQPLPTADMVSAAQSGHTILMAFDPDPINSTPTWQEIWQGQQDATLIKRAQQLRDFGVPVMVNFDHEADANIGPNGTPADYVKAYQHVHDLFQAQGATNVIWVWDMRGSLFTSPSNADAMYPGDQYVDWVAADAYNWYPGKSGSKWRSFSDAFLPFHQWATQQHPSIPQMAEETGVQEDTATPDAGRKAAWISDMTATIKSWPEMKAVVWFNSNQIYPWWYDSSTTSLDAFKAMAHDCYFDTRDTSCSGTGGTGTSGTGTGGGTGGGGTAGGTSLDTTGPTTPGGLTASNVQISSFSLSWTASTDDTGVAGYNVWVGGSKVLSTSNLSAAVTGVDCSTGCQVWVEAHDAAGNLSPRASITVQTPAPVVATAISNLTATPKTGQVKIAFTLGAKATVSITILDSTGSVVTHKLTNATLAAGPQTFYWKLKDDHGQPVAAGTYSANVFVSGTSGNASQAAFFHL
jgi:hypothetical protein